MALASGKVKSSSKIYSGYTFIGENPAPSSPIQPPSDMPFPENVPDGKQDLKGPPKCRPLSKEAWLNAPGKMQWDIQVALRGPDSNYGETLKWFTTAVIRGHMRKAIRVGGTVNEDLHMVILPRGNTSLGQDPELWNAHHFVGHIETAASWLSIPILYIPGEIWHGVMRGRSAHESAFKIQEVIKGASGIGNGPMVLSEELARHFPNCPS